MNGEELLQKIFSQGAIGAAAALVIAFIAIVLAVALIKWIWKLAG